MSPGAAAGDAPGSRWRPLGISERRDAVVSSIVPISEPFMHVFRDVVESESVRRTPATSLRPRAPQFGVARLRLRRLIAPGVKLRFQPAPRRAFPFGFGRQSIGFAGSIAKPRAIGRGIEPTHARDRLIGPLIERLEARVAEVRRGFPARFFQEDAIKLVSHGRAPEGEAIHPDAMRRAFVRRPRLAAHQKLARGDHDHFRLEVHGHSFNSFQITAYTTFVSTACIWEFCTDMRFAWWQTDHQTWGAERSESTPGNSSHKSDEAPGETMGLSAETRGAVANSLRVSL